MSEKKADGIGSLLGNPNALLALLTIVGGVWLVSQKLTSNRPVIPAGSTQLFVGDQKLTARLWEDPFKVPSASTTDGSSKGHSLTSLIEQIERRSEPGSKGQGMLLLPVMIAGGPYSEDHESRVRSRFAIVSALGQLDYVPEDAEHLGTLEIPWPTTQQVIAAERDQRAGTLTISHLWDESRTESGEPVQRLLGTLAKDAPTIGVRYEWYRPRVFGSRPSTENKYKSVLVLWLDDGAYEDRPLLRLALLLEQLTDPARFVQGKVAVIGPRRSSTLRAMLPVWRSDLAEKPERSGNSLEPLVKAVLGRIDLYGATPSAMDEVLVRSSATANQVPRTLVKEKLGPAGSGFASFTNFTATDSQMAAEVIDEIKLRGADLVMKTPEPTIGTNHVALISEWDTFYGRMLSLTYRAELVHRRDPSVSRADFVERPENRKGEPKNFHSLVYLRGLDGQTSNGNGGAESNSGSGSDGKMRIKSLEEIREWSPDVNKAEGQAQFDYLGRMGDTLEQLQRQLQRDNQGRLRAVGIVGSDVYDTLLILQALRHRFPNLLFFTTDLDVRFLHPREREWARNLIVVSSYGLTLHPALQGGVAPFRESTQTAQFAATLAALGHPALQNVAIIPPRRYEMGNRGAVDLSKDSEPIVPSAPAAHHAGKVRLHPLTASEDYRSRPMHDFSRECWALFAVALFVTGAAWVWTPLRRLTWDAWIYPSLSLDYTEEDIGGPDGAHALLSWIDTKAGDDAFATRLLEHQPLADARKRIPLLIEERGSIDARLEVLPAKESPQRKVLESRSVDLDWDREKLMALVAARLAACLNMILNHPPTGSSAISSLPLAPAPMSTPGLRLLLPAVLKWWPASRRMVDRWQTRMRIDLYLDQATSSLAAAGKHQAKQEQVVERPGKVGGNRLAAICRQHADFLLDDLLGKIEQPPKRDDALLEEKEDPKTAGFGLAALRAAHAARTSAESSFRLRCRRLVCFWAGTVLFAMAGIWMVVVMWNDTFARAEGEPFSLTSGISAWPAEVVRFGVLTLAVCFVFAQSHKLREAFLTLTRRFRLSPAPGCDLSGEYVCARTIWFEYRETSRFRLRVKRIVVAMMVYLAFLLAVRSASGELTMRPLRGAAIAPFDMALLWLSILGFLLLAFLTIDAACLCRRFIEKLGASPTRYPIATRRHFTRQMGGIDEEYIDEWIDVQLIAELTEKVGRLVYFPAALILLLFLARNSWWDGWSWSTSLVFIFLFNLTLALVSVVILQQSAKVAKDKAEQSLAAKVKRSQAQVAPSVAHHNATQAEALLTEIRDMNRGAFVPFWENPVVGAIFLSSGGTTLLQIAIWFVGR